MSTYFCSTIKKIELLGFKWYAERRTENSFRWSNFVQNFGPI